MGCDRGEVYGVFRGAGGMIYLGTVCGIIGMLFLVMYSDRKRDALELSVLAWTNFIIINIFSTAVLFLVHAYSTKRMLFIDAAGAFLF